MVCWPWTHKGRKSYTEKTQTRILLHVMMHIKQKIKPWYKNMCSHVKHRANSQTAPIPLPTLPLRSQQNLKPELGHVAHSAAPPSTFLSLLCHHFQGKVDSSDAIVIHVICKKYRLQMWEDDRLIMWGDDSFRVHGNSDWWTVTIHNIIVRQN